MRHRFRYFIASRMLAVHAACKSPSSKRALQKSCCLLCVIIPPWRVRPQLTSEEDFSKKPKRRVKSYLKYWLLKREKFRIIITLVLRTRYSYIFLPLYSKKDDLGTPTVLPSSIGMLTSEASSSVI